ncbi:MAG: hypothetical protein FJZ58_01620 [Chlamydiae bacterium]|nr:hypothetical protein [Chlamydiota bacterium]
MDYFASTSPVDDTLTVPQTFLIRESQSSGAGYINIESDFLCTADIGSYDRHGNIHGSPTFWTTQMQVILWVGIIPLIDLWVAPQVYVQWTEDQSSTQWGDLPVGMDIQLVKDRRDRPFLPGMELSLQLSLPTGKYDHLEAGKLGTDSVGAGSYYPGVAFSASKLIYLEKGRTVLPRMLVSYNRETAVPVRGVNAYGGGEEAWGLVHPGSSLTGNLGVDFLLDPKWSMTCDLYYRLEGKAVFAGRDGGIPIGNPALQVWSLAPSVGYHVHSWYACSLGAWFSLAGKNTSQFVNAFIAMTFSL